MKESLTDFITVYSEWYKFFSRLHFGLNLVKVEKFDHFDLVDFSSVNEQWQTSLYVSFVYTN